MRCDEVRETLLLSPKGVNAALVAHLADCAPCATFQAAHARLSGELERALVVEPPARLQAELLALIRPSAVSARQGDGWLQSIRRVAFYGALVLVLALIQVLADSDIAGLILFTLDGAFGVLEAFDSSLAIWSLAPLWEQLSWLPGLVLLLLVPRIVDREPVVRKA